MSCIARLRFPQPGPALHDVLADAGGPVPGVSLERVDTRVSVAGAPRAGFTFVEVHVAHDDAEPRPFIQALARRGGVDVLSLAFGGIGAPSASPVGLRLGGFSVWPEPIDVDDTGGGVRCPSCATWLSPVVILGGACLCGQALKRAR